MNVRSDVGGSRRESLIHGPVAVDKPLGNLEGLTDAVSISVVEVDDGPR